MIMRTTHTTRAAGLLLGLAVSALAAGCRNEMYDQPRYEPYEASDFFTDGLSARPLVAGTVPRGWAATDEHLFYGRVDGELATTFPAALFEDEEGNPIDPVVIVRRGEDQFNSFCLPCHGALGDGQGMVVQRGMPMPPSFHENRLVEMPVGHFYDVIHRGYGAMYSYAHRIKVKDRWAVVAYIRALQTSQNIPADALDESEQRRLEEAAQ